MKKKNVLFLLQYLSPGGIEWMVARLAERLESASDWQPHVLVYDQSSIKPIDNFFTERKIPLYRLQKGPGFSFKLLLQIAKVLREKNIQVIHAHHLGALIFAVLAKLLVFKNINIVYTQHSFIHLKVFPGYYPLEMFFCFFANQLTAVSQQVVDEFKSLGISQRPVALIPNGSVFPAHKVDQESELEKLREELFKKEKINFSVKDLPQKWALYLGRIHQGKGQDLALKLWAQLKPEDRKKMALIIVGPGSDLEYIEKIKTLSQQMPDANHIYFMGQTERPTEWMQAANLFLSCSESEGWPLAPLEALGSGVPCLLSDIQGHKMFQDWAQFFSLNDLKVGAEKLEQLACEPKFTEQRSLYWQKTQDLRAKYSIEKMTEQYIEVFSRH